MVRKLSAVVFLGALCALPAASMLSVPIQSEVNLVTCSAHVCNICANSGLACTTSGGHCHCD